MSHTVSVSLCVLGGSYVEAAADDLLVRAAEDNLLVGPLFALVYVAYVYPKQAHPPAQLLRILECTQVQVSQVVIKSR
jgi:hypothetical protein